MTKKLNLKLSKKVSQYFADKPYCWMDDNETDTQVINTVFEACEEVERSLEFDITWLAALLQKNPNAKQVIKDLFENTSF